MGPSVGLTAGTAESAELTVELGIVVRVVVDVIFLWMIDTNPRATTREVSKDDGV